MHALTEKNAVVCGTVGLSYGRLKTTSNMYRTGLEHFLNPTPNEMRRCKKCAAALNVEIPHVPVLTKESHFKVPYNRRHEAKNAGLWWNNDSKTWFAPRKHVINGGSFGHMTDYLHNQHAFTRWFLDGEEVEESQVINWNENGVWGE